jgi:hypothetical protein
LLACAGLLLGAAAPGPLPTGKPAGPKPNPASTNIGEAPTSLGTLTSGPTITAFGNAPCPGMGSDSSSEAQCVNALLSGKLVIGFVWMQSAGGADVIPTRYGVYKTSRSIGSNPNARKAPGAGDTLVAQGATIRGGSYPAYGSMLIPYAAHDCFDVRVFAGNVAPDTLQSPPSGVQCADWGSPTKTTTLTPFQFGGDYLSACATNLNATTPSTGNPTNVVGIQEVSSTPIAWGCANGTGAIMHSQTFHYPAISVAHGVISATLSAPGDLHCAGSVSLAKGNPGDPNYAPLPGYGAAQTWPLGGGSPLNLKVAAYANMFADIPANQVVEPTFRIDPRKVADTDCSGNVQTPTLTIVTLN